jgi:hypothetical protein
MGGRRAKSLSDIVGTGLSAQQASFTRAVGKKDPESITTSSAKLVAKSEQISDILYYVSKLADFVVKEARSTEGLNYAERELLAKKEWSSLKRKEGLEVARVVDDAIVSAVAKAIGKGRK